MKNDIETISDKRVNSDSNLIQDNKIKEKLNSRNTERKMNCVLLLLFIILIIIIIIFFYLLFSRRKKFKNISINKTQNINNKIICESGFYLPLDDPLAKNCKKCSIENCIECYGSKLKDICIKCNPGFKGIYINNKIESCDIPCEEGMDEKCKQCDNDKSKCLSCNDGYYLFDSEKTKCQKCSIDNCLECYGNKTSNNCTKCNSNLKEGYESDKNRTIISCKLPCETGNEDKCLKCDNIRNECIECNLGYKLVNDKCILNYSFKAIYKQVNKNEGTKLINKGSIIKMIIDGKEVKEPLSNYYYFNDTESHEIYFLINMEKFGISLNNLFYYVNRMISISFTNLFNTSNIEIMKNFFYQCSKLESINNSYNLDISKVKDMSYFFYYCYSLKSIDLSNFDTKNVRDLRGMFSGCSQLKSIDLSNFDTKNVTDLSGMFSGCSQLKSIDISNFDTKNVRDLSYMFYDCSQLKSIDLSNFDTKNVTDLSYMFYNCSALTSIDLSNFYTKTFPYIINIFFYCKDLKFINIANLNIRPNASLFNGILGKNGTIIANKNIYNNMDKTSKDSIVGWIQK